MVLHLIFHPQLQRRMSLLLAGAYRKAAVTSSATAHTQLGVMELPMGTRNFSLYSRWAGANITRSPEQSIQLWLGWRRRTLHVSSFWGRRGELGSLTAAAALAVPPHRRSCCWRCHGLGGRGEGWLCKAMLVSSLHVGAHSVPLKL